MAEKVKAPDILRKLDKKVLLNIWQIQTIALVQFYHLSISHPLIEHSLDPILNSTKTHRKLFSWPICIQRINLDLSRIVANIDNTRHQTVIKTYFFYKIK